jgi:serine phosphatase RsbU (regulator of sigma subunit)/AmiR/NasT family two-component response regulator
MVQQHILKVALASDQAIYLRGLVCLITSMPGFKVVGEAKNATEIMQLCRLTEPDVVMLDLKRVQDQEHRTADHINQQYPAARVILFHDPEEDDPEANTLPIGSQYHFSRDLSEEELKNALLQVRMEFCECIAAGHFQHQVDDEVEDLSGAVKMVRPFSKRRNEAHMTRELLMAGKIQADILPEKEPVIPGWEISAKLEPARETSGDFFDFIALTEHKWGIIVADVTDKGMGAALFMALSNTMIRTYAHQFPTLPAIVMNEVNQRLLSDTRGGMFVTTLYGILEPHSARFVYANAGNPPGYLFSPQRGLAYFDPLRRTGMALGVSEDAQWRQKIVKLSPGDYVVLFTDGITEAQNPEGQFFGEERLMDAVLAKNGRPAHEVRDAILESVHQFVGRGQPQDDITLVVIHRIE